MRPGGPSIRSRKQKRGPDLEPWVSDLLKRFCAATGGHLRKMHVISGNTMTARAMRAGDCEFQVPQSSQGTRLGINRSYHGIRGFRTSVCKNAHFDPPHDHFSNWSSKLPFAN